MTVNNKINKIVPYTITKKLFELITHTAFPMIMQAKIPDISGLRKFEEWT